MYEKMQSPISIGSLEVENRVVMPAIGVNLAAQGGGVSEEIISFYQARARGGVGLIISEITRVADGAGAGEPYQLAARGEKDVPGLKRLVDSIHECGSKFFIQLHHPGVMATPEVTGVKSVAPSAFIDELKGVIHELSTEECEDLVKLFINGAKVAKEAGADGVELHAAHGYLINEFLSPAMNLRTDKYGGDFEGRMRFLAEIIGGIRKLCGTDFPISVRINAKESLPGGIDIKAAQKIAKELESLGVDVINISCLSEVECIEPGSYKQGWKKHMPAAIKEVVNIPIIAVCNIKEPQVGEELLQERACDLIAVGRGHLADPEWSNKAFEGLENEIIKCTGCLACFGEICKLNPIKCTVNSVTGHELERK